jgi:hypothetical protein
MVASIPLTSRIYTEIYNFLYSYVGLVDFSVYLCLKYTGKEQTDPLFLDPNFSQTSLTLILEYLPPLPRGRKMLDRILLENLEQTRRLLADQQVELAKRLREIEKVMPKKRAKKTIRCLVLKPRIMRPPRKGRFPGKIRSLPTMAKEGIMAAPSI